MTNRNPIHTFNTGRHYTAAGQRIAYQVIARSSDEYGDQLKVAFNDIDRGIDGAVWVFADFGEEPSNSAVLAAYDRGGYTWIEPDVSARLRQAFDQEDKS